MQQIEANELIDRLGMDYLRDASAFGALSPAAITFLMQGGRVLALEKGDVLYEPGDKGDRFFIVLQGALAFFQFHLGEFAFIRNHRFGEEMGFVAMIALHERVGRAVAAEDGYVLEVPCGLFHQLHRDMPVDFGLFLLNLSREMARTIREVSDLVVENAIARHQTLGTSGVPPSDPDA